MTRDQLLLALKRHVGTEHAGDDVALGTALDAAIAWVAGRVCDDPALADADEGDERVDTRPDVQQAAVMVASRLYHRRRSPEGTSGFGGDGSVVRVLSRDPDVARLLELHLDYSNAGIG